VPRTTQIKENRFTKRREPFKFMLGLGILGSVLVFTVLLAVYALRKSAGVYWTDVPLPSLFWVSTATIVLSSFTLHLSHRAFKTDHFTSFRANLVATLLLGILFVILQLLGWKQLIDAGISTVKNPSVGFVYVLSGLHVVHILIGIGALGWLFFKAFQNHSYVDSFVFSVNPPNQLRMRLIVLYWHFVDILWLYLFAFLLYHHGI
jgi:cytochrome c oxidase subunit III